MTRLAVLTIAVLCLLAAPARGAGGPVAGGDAGPAGVTARGLSLRYVAQSVRGGTLLVAVQRRGGAVVATRLLHERLIVPAVAYDGSATGLSADGTTLVLAAPARRRSRFAVFDARTLRRRATVSLRGTYSLDAISPDGGRLYLIESHSADGTRYAVRAYDLGRRRMLREPIVDPAEADEPMRGSPIARVMSRDGRWAYTLYDGDGKAPFIHALDTERARAKCVDLDALAGRGDLGALRLRLMRDGSIVVRDGVARAVLVVDPRSFALRAPGRAAPVAERGGGTDWLAPVVGVAVLALLAALAVFASRRRRTGDLGELRL